MSDFQRAIVYSWQHDYIMPSYKTGIPLEAVTLPQRAVEQNVPSEEARHD